MVVNIISKETITPTKPTPHHLRNFKICLLDQLAPSYYIPLVLFYTSNLNENQNISKVEVISHLKSSLAKTLTIFYPLAGRMKDCMTVDCNDSGIPFVVARMSCCLDEILKSPPTDSMCDFVPFNTNCFQDNIEGLVGIQVTLFDCGGIVIGVCMHHRTSDAMSMTNFIKCWADETATTYFQMTKGDIVNPDFTTARELFPPVDCIPEKLLKTIDNNSFENFKCVQRRYVFDKNAIASLQSKSSSDETPKPTRNEALTSFIWKHMMEASKIIRGSSFTSLQIFVVNLRPRFKPPLSSNTYGNLWWFGLKLFDVSLEGKTKPVELCNLVELSPIDVDFVEKLQKPGAILGFLQENQNDENQRVKTVGFSNWCNFGHYNIDFGWGSPIWIAYAHKNDALNNRITFMMDSRSSGLEIWMIAKEEEIFILESNPEFLKYANINPSVI